MNNAFQEVGGLLVQLYMKNTEEAVHHSVWQALESLERAADYQGQSELARHWRGKCDEARTAVERAARDMSDIRQQISQKSSQVADMQELRSQAQKIAHSQLDKLEEEYYSNRRSAESERQSAEYSDDPSRLYSAKASEEIACAQHTGVSRAKGEITTLEI